MKGERVQTLGIEIAKGDLVLMSIDAFEKKRADFVFWGRTFEFRNALG